MTDPIPAPADVRAAVKRWEEAVYHRRHVLGRYGKESWGFTTACTEAAYAREVLTALVPAGAAYLVLGLLGERVLRREGDGVVLETITQGAKT